MVRPLDHTDSVLALAFATRSELDTLSCSTFLPRLQWGLLGSSHGEEKGCQPS